MGAGVPIKRVFQDQSLQTTLQTCASFDLQVTIDHRNQRAIVHTYGIREPQPFFNHLNSLTADANLTKIIIYARANDIKRFLRRGFRVEAMNPYYFRGQPVYYLSRFLTGQRKTARDTAKKDSIVSMAQAKADSLKPDRHPVTPATFGVPGLPDGFTLRRAAKSDIAQLIKLYKRVFSSYPTPIHDQAYLLKTMAGEASCFVVITNQEQQIISAASADIDSVNLCAEITDCATYPRYRGQKLMYHLVQSLEQIGRQTGLCSLYTLARAQSPGMNIVFSRNGYHYGGRLVHNCHICGSYEDMNLWVKKLKT